MGYTHYFESDRPFVLTHEIVQQVQKIIDTSSVEVAGWDGTGFPTVNTTEIRLNGVGADAYETLLVESGMTGFRFCKTGRAPYDEVVTAILILLEQYGMSITSDGDREHGGDWDAGFDLYERALETVHE